MDFPLKFPSRKDRKITQPSDTSLSTELWQLSHKGRLQQGRVKDEKIRIQNKTTLVMVGLNSGSKSNRAQI